MHLEATVYLEEDINKIFSNLTDIENYIWKREIKEVKIIDKKHYIEYTNKDYPTFFTVVKKTKNKKYSLEFTNNEAEGGLKYELSLEEEKVILHASLDFMFVDVKPSIFAKRKWNNKWKHFAEDLKKIGK